MADIKECPNCGAAMGPNERQCKYCGSLNPNFVDKKPLFKSEKANEIKDNIVNVTNSVSEKIDVKNVNWFLAIILLIVCCPIGIIYIILSSLK